MDDGTRGRAAGSLLERALSGAGARTGETDANTAVLDAAHDLFCRQGIQRTTMDDVARRAGISRITVYRRLTSKDALVEEVVLREFRRYFDQFLLDVAGAATAEERVERGFVSSLRSIRGNRLIQGLLETEPELVAPALVSKDSPALAMVGDFVAGQLRREQAAGHVAGSVDVDLVAELMVRVSASFLLTPSARLDLDDEEVLRTIARTCLVPMLRPAG